MRQRTIGLVLAGLITGAAIAAITVELGTRPGPAAVETGTALVGGPFTLTDQTGKRVTDKDFHGRIMMVFFGFTNCPDICPAALQVMTAALDKMGSKAGAVTPVFITLDAERDTPEKLSAYLKSFHPSFVGLTGSDAEIASVVKAYRLYAQKVTDEASPASYTYDHAAIIYIMGKDGSFIAHVPQVNNPDDLVAALDRALQ